MTIHLIRIVIVLIASCLTSCMTMIDKEFTALEARMPTTAKPNAIVGMWHNKLKSGPGVIMKGTSHSILFRSDGTVNFRGANVVQHEARGIWKYEGNGRWLVDLEEHPENWHFRTDGEHLLQYVDFLSIRTRLVFVRAENAEAVAAERPR